MSSAAFLVYIAAVLFYKPIFTQPLGFVLCAAGAVEKFATDGTVSVVYLRDSISISKINAAFLTGQQIDRIHVQKLLLPSFMCQGAQHLLLYHVPSPKTIAFLTKDADKKNTFDVDRFLSTLRRKRQQVVAQDESFDLYEIAAAE